MSTAPVALILLIIAILTYVVWFFSIEEYAPTHPTASTPSSENTAETPIEDAGFSTIPKASIAVLISFGALIAACFLFLSTLCR